MIADWQDNPVRVSDAVDLLRQLHDTGLRPSLVYIDPPFGLGRDFTTSSARTSPSAAFSDRWPDGLAGYLAWMETLIAAIHESLTGDGSLLLHCDQHASPYLAQLCDTRFGFGERGAGNANVPGFRNELVWHYGLGGSSNRAWPRKHDTILWYTRSTHWFFEPPMVPATSARMKGKLKKHPDVIDIPSLNNMARERTGWPTQKPLALLELLIAAHAPPGALVVDPCCGSGTTLVAAQRLGRTPIGGDISPDAVSIARKRLGECTQQTLM